MINNCGMFFTVALLVVALLEVTTTTTAWQSPFPSRSSTPQPTTTKTTEATDTNRRAALEGFVGSTTIAFLPASSVLAQPDEFKNLGTQAPVPAGGGPGMSGAGGDTEQFQTLSNGVKIKDFQVGSGSETVGSGSRVSVQCSGRLLNLNGVVFYNTKNNNPDGFGAIPLTFTIGKGEALPGLEAGIVGMKKNGIRRIIVPAELAYNQYPDLEPKPMNQLDQQALDSVVKNPRRDATILFDVRLERFK